MADARPRVAFFGGGEIGLGFFGILSSLRRDGECEVVCVCPTGRAAADNEQLAAAARLNAVPLAETPQDVFAHAPLDLIFSAGNTFFFSREYIDLPRLGIVNLHAAPLPDYRGSACPAFAILNGEANFGVTFHVVVEALDAGPVLHIERFPLAREATAAEIDQRCIEVALATFRRIAPALLRGELEAMPQTGGRAPYRRKDIEPHRRVDLSWPTERIWDHVRACDWNGVLPPAYTELDGRRIYLTARPRGDWLERDDHD